MSKFSDFFLILDKKPVLDEGVIGCYDSKPFDNFKYAMRYANEKELFEPEMTEKVEIYTREYKGVTFVNFLVFDEEGFDINSAKYEKCKELLISKGITPADKSVVVVAFQHNNENTINMAKSFCESDKNHFEQALVYNPREVRMDFYKPVPKFYKLYDKFCEDIYFDFAFIDKEAD